LLKSCSRAVLLVVNDGMASPLREEASLCFHTSATYSPFHLFF